ncbi:MAG: FecCD family ABC transporter permease [Actinomycetaceae bacterium]
MSTAVPARESAAERPLTWPRGIVPTRLGPFGIRIEIGPVVVTVLALLAAVAVGAWSLTVGDDQFGAEQVLEVLRGTADDGTYRVIVEWRLSRIVLAMVAGGALAVSGALFQSITRNPLGSPDIIGFSTGAYTGALVIALFTTGTALQTSIGALVGGLLTGAFVYLLAYKGGASGMRIIVVGIGVSLFLSAANTWMLTTLSLDEAVTAASWSAGDLSNLGRGEAVPTFIGLAICLPVALWFATDMRMLEMGDDSGRGLGVRAETVRALMLVVGVVLVSIVTAAAGPIAFVALAAPQLAMRLARTPGVRILPSLAVGSLLLVTSDLISKTVIAPNELPVGVVTLVLGGAYLVWLLAGFSRKARS